MKEVTALIVFCIVLFLYIHIYFHLKQSNDLEVYEIDQPSKDKLEEICDLRQPVIINYENERLLESCNLNNIKTNYSAFDVKIRNVKDNDDETEMYFPLRMDEVLEIVKNDKESKYISEKNGEFLEESSLIKNYRYNDLFLRPPLVSSCMYDLLLGSYNVETPLRYELNYRNYFLVTQGKVIIKLIPPKSSKYLYGVNDYYNFEFRSPVNPWNVQNQYKADFDKIKTLEVVLTPGKLIYIPAYWWYSIKFVKSNSSICTFKYRTYMSTVSIINHLVMKALQGQNVKRMTVKKAEHTKDDIQELRDLQENKEIKKETNEESEIINKNPIDLNLIQPEQNILNTPFPTAAPSEKGITATAIALEN